MKGKFPNLNYDNYQKEMMMNMLSKLLHPMKALFFNKQGKVRLWVVIGSLGFSGLFFLVIPTMLMQTIGDLTTTCWSVVYAFIEGVTLLILLKVNQAEYKEA